MAHKENPLLSFGLTTGFSFGRAAFLAKYGREFGLHYFLQILK
jgi:hypothetical protein